MGRKESRAARNAAIEVQYQIKLVPKPIHVEQPNQSRRESLAFVRAIRRGRAPTHVVSDEVVEVAVE